MSIKYLAGVAALSVIALASAGAVPAGLTYSASRVCKDGVTFRVYFDPESARVDRHGRDLIGLAMNDLQGCGRTDAAFAADPRAIRAETARRSTSERSVAVLNSLRDFGFDGDVFVTNLSDTVVAAERNAGPEFIEVTLAPRAGGLYASVWRLR